MTLQGNRFRDRCKARLKAVWLGSWVILATLAVFGPVTLAAWLEPSQRIADWLCKRYARTLLLVAGVKTRSTGVEKIERGRPYAIIVNHQSHFDALALVLELPMCIRWVAKKELMRIPLFGLAVASMRNIAVDRSDPLSARKSLEKGVRRLPKGASLLFFAEGTRSSDGKVGRFKKGGFWTAREVRWPILPVAVHGSGRLLPKGSLDFHPGTIEIEVLDPIPAEQVQSMAVDELTERVRRLILEHSETREATSHAAL
ncbi:MAG: lysophospholipid acyltransferase family protein [bacterium]